MSLAIERLPAVVIRERTWIPKELVISADKIRADLTIDNGAVRAAEHRGFAVREDVPREFYLWEENEGFFAVPRAYMPPLRGERDVDYRVVDCTGRRGSIVGRDAVRLGPHELQPFDQREGFEALVAPDAPPHGRMFVLRCGGGKTAIAMKAAHARGGRTLWVTITDALVDQARADIARYLDLHQRRIGHVQAHKQRWQGYGIAVSTLQTLALSTSLPAEFWEYWDLVIFDEGDVLGAPAFHKVVPKFRAERWVLTATPKRSDGNDELFTMHTGPICYLHTEFDLEPECYFISTQAGPELLGYAGWDTLRHQRRVQYAITAKNLLLDERRQQLIIAEVLKALSKERTILAVGDSVEGIATLAQRMRDLNIEAGTVTSHVKRAARREAIKVPPVVCATSKIFQRGLDRVAFDTLLMTTLTTTNAVFTNQLAGRILRANKDDPDKRPVIVVLTDVKVEQLRMMAASLAERFTDLGWTVNELGQKLLAERKAKRKARV